jgi:hypothetical protein
MKTILVYLLLITTLMATPETEEILDNPFDFADYTQCFIVKAKKNGEPFGYYFKSFAEVLWFSKEFNLQVIYFQDCDKIRKWRKLTRALKGE